jgi:hypothetical protein
VGTGQNGTPDFGPGYEYLSAGSEMRVFDYLDIDATSRVLMQMNKLKMMSSTRSCVLKHRTVWSNYLNEWER